MRVPHADFLEIYKARRGPRGYAVRDTIECEVLADHIPTRDAAQQVLERLKKQTEYRNRKIAVVP